ncbi:hypothetical protein [Mesorhizobium sp. 8]|uniref:hypothetical protein n=1 Tax=Mesorhizobium sp. 8 TaxID=2584466 RepID=UPI00111DCEB6|nr:hypothetical protein [Mesorhizobium sp. 8]QDC02717.1 hypothetical protein FGU64_21110 [Mesorhizobium sp. 8]
MAESVRPPETRDVWPRALIAFGVGLLVFLAVSAVALKFVFDTTPVWPPPGPAAESDRESPALQRTPESDLAAFRSKEDKELTTLGWVNRTADIARIPVEEAMKLVAQDGLPNWSKSTAALDGECTLLDQNVPRAPQVGNCRGGAKAGAGP